MFHKLLFNYNFWVNLLCWLSLFFSLSFSLLLLTHFGETPEADFFYVILILVFFISMVIMEIYGGLCTISMAACQVSNCMETIQPGSNSHHFKIILTPMGVPRCMDALTERWENNSSLTLCGESNIEFFIWTGNIIKDNINVSKSTWF